MKHRKKNTKGRVSERVLFRFPSRNHMYSNSATSGMVTTERTVVTATSFPAYTALSSNISANTCRRSGRRRGRQKQYRGCGQIVINAEDRKQFYHTEGHCR